MREGHHVLQGQLCWRKKECSIDNCNFQWVTCFLKDLGKSEWKMLLQAGISKWSGIGPSEISIWCDILKWGMSCQQVGLFHSYQAHFVLTFLCSKFLEFFMPLAFHLPILILQQFAIGHHFPLDGNSISCVHPGLTLQGNRKKYYKRIAE